MQRIKMRRRDSWINNTKHKLENFLYTQVLPPSRQNCDHLPPRIQKHGISIAARVVGNGIRDFTKRTTGKDLAQLKNSRTREIMLTKLSAIRVAVTNKQTQYSLLALACDTGSNLVTSLSPEGPECDYNFKKKNMFTREFIAKYHQQCTVDCHNIPEKKVPIKSYVEKLSEGAHKCRCNVPKEEYKKVEEEKKGLFNFLDCWHHKGILQNELDNYWNENASHFVQDDKRRLSNNENNEWSNFIENEKYIVFRRKLQCGLYEYRVQATFPDISAQKLFQTQVDGQYRKQWDEYVLKLSIVDNDKETSTDLVHWVTKCPYPFATREYIYLRRSKIDIEKKFMLLYSKATEKSDVPKDKNIERVNTYVSKLIIKPHRDSFDQCGCDFLLTYYDDPNMRLPQRILDMAASKGISDSMSRMYNAAANIEDKEPENIF